VSHPPGAPGRTGRYEHRSRRHDARPCAPAIQTGGGTGTWGPYEVEVGTGGQIHVDEPIGMLRRPESQDEDVQRG
jgi:hypothetical protein